MKQLFPTTGIGKLCGLFGKTRQAFYDHLWRGSDDQLQEALIIDQVQRIRARIPGIGGLPLHKMLKDELLLHDISLGRDRFYILLKKYNLLIKRKKRYVITTDSNHFFYRWPDLRRDLKVKAIERLWVSDITYLRTQAGFVYLSLITDAYSRKITGYHLSQRLKAQGCMITLNKAMASLGTEKQDRKLIHHSDHGIQYCCDAYVSVLQQNNILISMTHSGSPYENAIAERVNGILKHQLGLGQMFKDYAEATAKVCHAIDAYNRLRPHMSISNMTLEQQAHKTEQTLTRKWKSKKYPVKQIQE
jgi:transposase InsO family protein